MAISTTTAIPLANYTAGIYTLNETAIPDNVNAIRFACDRSTSAAPTIWPSQTVQVTIKLDLFDGTDWTNDYYFWSDVGGVRTLKGVEIPQSYAVWGVPVGTGRKVRGTCTITGGTCRTQGYVSLTTPD